MQKQMLLEKCSANDAHSEPHLVTCAASPSTLTDVIQLRQGPFVIEWQKRMLPK